MTRAQQSSIYDTATQNASDAQKVATQAASDTNSSISDYSKAVSKLASENPYGTGGEYASSQTQGLSDVSNAGTQALGAQLQSVAQRTGQNPAASVAATEAGAAQNTRDLATSLAKTNEDRIDKQSGYNQNVTEAESKIPSMYESLYSTAGNQALGNENVAESAAASNKSFGDSFGTSLASGLGSSLAKLATNGGTALEDKYI